MPDLYDDRKLKEVIERLGPWFYCWSLPGGLTTGGSDANILIDKMRLLIDGGAFQRSVYPNVLDLGANSGYIAKWFVDNKQSKVVAVENARNYYQQLCFITALYGLTEQIIPQRCDIVQAYLGAMEFDLVLLLGILHHLEEEDRLLLFERCYMAIVPGGEFVIQTDFRIDVPKLLLDSNFTCVEQVYDNIQERSAWKAKRPLGS